MKSQKPNFYYTFKAKRTLMLREKEPEKKEQYHTIYLRAQEKEQMKRDKEKAKKEKLRMEQEKREYEEWKNKPCSNFPAQGSQPTLNINVGQLAAP